MTKEQDSVIGYFPCEHCAYAEVDGPWVNCTYHGKCKYKYNGDEENENKI